MTNRRVWLSLGAAFAIIAGSLAFGALFRGPEAQAVKPVVVDTEPVATVETTTTTAAPTREPNPPAVVLPELNGATLSQGASSAVVQAYKQRLKDVRFDPGDVDPNYDLSTIYAVETLQKVKGLEPTGVIGEPERLALNTFTWPEPVEPKGEAKRFEVDINKQVGTLYVDNKIKLMTTISTGGGYYYCWTPKKGPAVKTCEYGDTPSGKFAFYTKYNGWQEGDLGKIYNPVYFNGGIAVHGYPQVPVQPASHGCVRIPMYIADYFPSLVDLGDPVYVVGGPERSRGVTRTPIPEDSSATPAPAPSTKPSPTAAPTTRPATTTTTVAPTTTTTAAPTTTTTAA